MESSSLDSLATQGIVNFDTEAYIKGSKPRYIGNPGEGNYLPLDEPLTASVPHYGITPGAHLSGKPSADAFVLSKEEAKGEHSSHLTWKEIIAGGSVATLALYVASKCTGTKGGKSLLQNITDACKNGISKIKTAVNGQGASATTAAAATAASSTTTAAPKKTNILSSIKNKISSLPKKVKVAGGIGLAALALYEFCKPKHPQMESEVHGE